MARTAREDFLPPASLLPPARPIAFPCERWLPVSAAPSAPGAAPLFDRPPLPLALHLYTVTCLL